MSGPKPKKAHPNPTPKKKATTHPTPNSITEENPAALAIPLEGGFRDTGDQARSPQKARKHGGYGRDKEALEGQTRGHTGAVSG
jgi:hypothetical protein